MRGVQAHARSPRGLLLPQVPSGILNPKATCVVGNGVVMHLPGFFEEIDMLEAAGVTVRPPPRTRLSRPNSLALQLLPRPARPSSITRER